MLVNLKSGLTTLAVNVPEGITIGQILSNTRYAAVMNWPHYRQVSPYPGHRGGDAYDTILLEGDTLLIHSVSSTHPLLPVSAEVIPPSSLWAAAPSPRVESFTRTDRKEIRPCS
jgi:hypothetical protein